MPESGKEVPSTEPTPVDAQPASHEDLLALDHIRFFTALFSESDTILFRPVETWTEDKKRSRPIYKQTVYRAAAPALLHYTYDQMQRVGEREKANIFFGVCPRLGDHGRFDLAWQIRKVPALWTDIDDITVDAARAAIANTELPEPSILVNSGNGVHVYWLLSEPYLIEDAGAPPAVQTEWIDSLGGKKKPRKYIEENGDRIYLDQRRHVSRLSAKAQHVQDVLAGIANACGGDHTTDLSRLLRVPGTLNRKDQRNGRDPIPTVLVECDATRRYSFAEFERFVATSPDTQRVQQIASMPLPRTRKTSAAKADKLAELIAASAIAEPGTRSEADFAVCCFAIRHGISKDEVWSQVANVGKFAEQGERYFDVTWVNAEFDTRAAVFDKAKKLASPVGSAMVERWKAAGMPLAKCHSRFNKRGWGNIVGGVLEFCGEPDFLANADEAAAQLDDTRREFAELVALLAENSRGMWTATELIDLCAKEGLLAADLGEGTPRSLTTKMGTLAGRFVDEQFPLDDGCVATFRRTKDRKGNVYQVFVAEEVPNLGAFAEPMPNLENATGSAA